MNMFLKITQAHILESSRYSRLSLNSLHLFFFIFLFFCLSALTDSQIHSCLLPWINDYKHNPELHNPSKECALKPSSNNKKISFPYIDHVQKKLSFATFIVPDKNRRTGSANVKCIMFYLILAQFTLVSIVKTRFSPGLVKNQSRSQSPFENMGNRVQQVFCVYNIVKHKLWGFRKEIKWGHYGGCF